MTILIRLYAHDHNAIRMLEQVRVNPDFTSRFRSDLEFFIPQLCCFFLKGDSQDEEALVNLIVMASTSSFFYSHRIWFFFQAMLFPESDPLSTQLQIKSRQVLKNLKDACFKSRERLYLTNSRDIIQLIQEFNLVEQYPFLKAVLNANKQSEKSGRLKSQAEENAERAEET